MNIKSFLYLLFTMTIVVGLNACSPDDGPMDEPSMEIPENPDDPDQNPSTGKILIAYFSRWGNTDYPADVDASTGASIIINNGNRRGTTQVVADYIQAAVGGDIHLIETSDPYPVDFDDVRDLNHSEQANGTRPALKSRIENMAQYETVFIGYPVWATTVPQAIRSFLEAYDFAGKTVVPFCTHDGYGAGSSYRAVQDAVSGATVPDGLALLASDVPSSESRVREWLEQIGIERKEPQGTTIRITVGERTFTGEWLDTPLASEIREMFPLTATLGRYGGREYYGSMPQRPTHTEEGQLHFENGDITYCPSNNTIAIFYAKADDPDMGTLTMRIIPIGKVTSNLGAFDEMESRLEFTFDNVQ